MERGIQEPEGGSEVGGERGDKKQEETLKKGLEDEKDEKLRELEEKWRMEREKLERGIEKAREKNCGDRRRMEEKD